MSAYARVLVHWFSGTGNALTAARWLAEDARSAGLDASLVPMQGGRSEGLPAHGGPGEVDHGTLHCFCYPTHGFAPPWLVLRYLWRFRAPRGDAAFLLNTRAGVRVPFVFVPGLSGVALWWPALLLAARGLRIAGTLPLDPPHNWVSFFPPNPRWGVSRLLERARRIVARTSERLFAGRRCFRWSVWLTLPLDAAIAPLSLLYVLVGRFGLAKTLFASGACNGCGLCVERCPVGAIVLVGGRPFWRATCESCMRCMNLCPRRSVQSWVTRMGLVTWALVAAGQAVWPLPTAGWLLAVTPLYLPIYRLLHLAWGNRAINAAFTVTSLTRWWGRYRAPGVGANDLG